MGQINVLDAQVANLIAAGEVVERPASAVKELLENAIDAGATRIVAEIKQGGVGLMRITDNGCGMSKEDAVLCICRHATSKIKTAADLDGIETLGFRGEALAAIASVSRMRILTRRKGEETGVSVETQAGKILSVEESGCPVGTTIIVEELFANVPARRKFLKRDAAETAAVAAVLEKIALSRPDVAIKFIADGALRFQTVGDNDLLNVIYAVLGRDFAKKTAVVHDMTDGVEVLGVIGTPDNIRGNRGAQNFFINGRYVRCGTASAALEQAFHSYIPSDKFPTCVLALNIHPAFVDVNVHPQKLEVKFSNEKPIFNAVYCAVKNVLTNAIQRPTVPSVGHGTHMTGDSYQLYADVMSMKTESEAEAEAIASEKERLRKKYEQIVIPTEVKDQPLPELEVSLPSLAPYPKGDCAPIRDPMVCEKSVQASVTPPSVTPAPTPAKDLDAPTRTSSAETGNTPLPSFERLHITPSDATPMKDFRGPYGSSLVPDPTAPWFRVAGVAFNCYIFVEMEDKMLVIDKHAAHERVLFEKLRMQMQSAQPTAQLLLLPLEIDLTPEERDTASAYYEELTALGFAFALDTEKKLSLQQYPSGLQEEQAITLFTSLLDGLGEGASVGVSREVFYERMLYQAACKAAVKAGRYDTPENIRWIAEQVIVNPKVRYCPHGRPVAFEMTKGQFERQFERS